MKLLAIAINTIRHALRIKLALVFVLFFIVVLVSVPFTLKSDGTQRGKVQITLAYSLGVLNIVLSVLTLFLSTSTFCSDIRNKVIFTIDTKPVKRWEILAGKWIGIMIIDTALLICLGAAIYGAVRYTSRPLEGREGEYPELRREVLTARVETVPVVARNTEKTASVVPFRHEKEWTFENIKCADSEKIITLKFRYYTSGGSDEKISGLWTARSKDRGFYEHVTTLPAKSFHEFRVPASVVSSEGGLRISFLNISAPGVSVIFPGEDVTILYRVGNFGGNFLRAMLLVLLRLAFIAAVALGASTFLTFPVATLFSIFVLIMSLSVSSFRVLIQGSPLPVGGPRETIAPAAALVRKVTGAGLKVLPDLRAYDPVPYLVSGVLIRWRSVIEGFIWIVLLRSGVIGCLAYVIFNRRELAI
jgi:hypothetical protein